MLNLINFKFTSKLFAIYTFKRKPLGSWHDSEAAAPQRGRRNDATQYDSSSLFHQQLRIMRCIERKKGQQMYRSNLV